MNSSLPRFLAAFGLGATAALVGEVLVYIGGTYATLPLLGASATGLLGGSLAVLVLCTANLVPRATGPTFGAFGGAAAALPLAFFVNVYLLKGWPMKHPVSLTVDSVLIGSCIFLGGVLGSSEWVARLSARATRPLATVGLALLVIMPTILTLRFPTTGVDVRPTASGPNLVLVYIDSLRADRFLESPLGRDPAIELNEWARGGRRFTNAWSSSSWTAPSVNRTMLPPRGPLPAGQTLAEALAEKGYATACFTDNPHLTSHAKFLHGFQRIERSVGAWRMVFRRTAFGQVLDRFVPGSDRALVDRMLDWARTVHGPFFLYAHLMDAHAPYKFPPIDGARRGGRHLTSPTRGLVLTAEEREDVESRYDAGVQVATREALRGVRALAELGPAVMIVSADHGESLGEGNRWSHGDSLHPELVRVPFVVSGLGVPAGVVDDVVGADSIAYTLLAAAGSQELVGKPRDLRTGAGDDVTEGALPPEAGY